MYATNDRIAENLVRQKFTYFCILADLILATCVTAISCDIAVLFSTNMTNVCMGSLQSPIHSCRHSVVYEMTNT